MGIQNSTSRHRILFIDPKNKKLWNFRKQKFWKNNKNLRISHGSPNVEGISQPKNSVYEICLLFKKKNQNKENRKFYQGNKNSLETKNLKQWTCK